MPQIEQVFRYHRRRLLFIGFHRISNCGIVINHRHRHTPFNKLREVMVVFHAKRRPHDEAIHAPVEEPIQAAVTSVGQKIGKALKKIFSF